MLQKTNSPLVQKPMINNQISDVVQDHVLVQKENQQLVIAKNQQIQNIAKQIDSITSIEQAMTKLALNDPATLNRKPDAEILPPAMVQPWTLDVLLSYIFWTTI
jgi:formaldehyde-activating enzyme involved in methanogenesis